MLRISPSITLDESELKFRFIRASGPGGQNVNKVATAVQLRFDVLNSQSLPQRVRERLLLQAKNRISAEGVLIIDARQFRTQERNRQDALERLAALIQQASIVPKRRIKTKPSKASKERKLEQKKRRSGLKQSRRRPDFD